MNVKRLRGALAGERILAVEPPLVPELIDPPGRLNLYDGRALSAGALSRGQENRSGRIAALGRATSAGVVTGLELGLETATGAPVPSHLAIAPGLGVTIQGENLVVGRAQRFEVSSLTVYAPSSFLADPDSADAADMVGSWRFGPSLGTLARPESVLPRVGVIVLRPVVVGRLGEADTGDPCEQDPEDLAFEDLQGIDGLEVVLHVWPLETLPLPDPDERWRNRLAHEVFAAERQLASGERMPWWAVGLPIGLIAFDTDWTPLFVDRHSVSRAGGGLRERPPLIPGSGSVALWQAQMEQLAEQFAEAMDAASSPESMAAGLRYLPPVGLLPTAAVQPRGGLDRFFPSSYHTVAMPVPLEQLDVAIRESLPLRVFDTFVADRVEVMVPVPQIWFKPELLVEERLDSEFDSTIEAFSERRGRWLRRRMSLREIASALMLAAYGRAPEYTDPDPDALEVEELIAAPGDVVDPGDPDLAEVEQDYGTESSVNGRVVTRIETLRTYLRERTPLRHESSVLLDDLDPALEYPAAVTGRIRYETQTNRLVFTGVMSEAQRDLLLRFFAELRRTDAVRAVPTLFELSQRDEVGQLDELGLVDFIKFLQSKVDQANDKVDFGFLRVQTEIYRTRQLVLGNEDATRLATSPVLAAIAQGETAVATREDLSRYLEAVRRPGDSVERPPSPSGTAAARAPGAGFTAAPSAGGSFLSGDLGGVTRVGGVGDELLAGGTRFDRIDRGTVGTKESVIVRDQELSKADLFKSETVTRDDILGKEPIVGASYEFRNVTVADRLSTPPSQEAKTGSLSTKYEVLSNLVDLDLEVDDLQVPGFRTENEEVRRSIADVRRESLLGEVLSGQHDLNPGGLEDEGAFFSAGVRALENSISILRLVEGRVQAYRRAIERCRADLSTIERDVAVADVRLKAVGDGLAEARHDVSVAQALRAEEVARIGDLNARRDRILAEHVPFLVYRRPPLIDESVGAPSRTLDPALREAPVPACLRADAEEAPVELRETVDLLRDAPLRWLVLSDRLMSLIDRIEDLRLTVESAQVRARSRRPAAARMNAVRSAGRTGANLFQLFAGQFEVISGHRASIAALDPVDLLRGSLVTGRQSASRVLSLGDIVDGDRRRVSAARLATAELENLHRVATCLYRRFSAVPASLRLDWIERLSQFDAGFSLRNLYALPRWGEIARLERRDMQSLADWLYGRFRASEREAIAFANALIRVTLLLASHAPVDRILAARTASATVANPGSRVDIVIDPARTRIGMSVLIYTAAEPVAIAVLEDLEADRGRARIVRSSRSGETLPAGSRAQLVEDSSHRAAFPGGFDAIGFAPAPGSRLR